MAAIAAAQLRTGRPRRSVCQCFTICRVLGVVVACEGIWDVVAPEGLKEVGAA